MKTKSVLSLILATIGLQSMAQVKPAIPRDEKIEAQVETILARLSLDEKVGQMCELTIDPITDFSKPTFTLNEEGLKNAIDRYKVGSFLNVPLSLAATPEVWADYIRYLNKRSMEQCNGVPQVYGVDQIHGTTYTWGGTLFPQEINQAASFNRTIPFRVAEICAYETRACLIPWVYAPVMDLGRNPLWPRMWESYGEDSYLNAQMAVQAVRGFQGEDPNHIDMNHVGVSLKHYMAYGVPTSGKDRTPSNIPDRDLLEKYFQPFRQCAQAGALTIMVNSANNNGVPFHANHKLLTEWFKEGLNWDGMIVTDWADIDNLWKRDHTAANKQEAIAQAINAGIDMSMDPYSTDFCDLLKKCVQEGDVPMSRIDDAVRRILRFKIRVGLMDTKTWDIPTKKLAKQYKDFGCDAFGQEATKMAEETMVLLKNQGGILPLHQGQKILVTGPNANNMRAQNGGWTYSWQGDKCNEVCAQIGKYKTFYQAISDKFGAENVVLCEGVTYQEGNKNFELENTPDFQAAVDAAKNCDVIIACIGENSYAETPGNINDLTLSPNQSTLVQKLAQTGKPIVLVLNEGRPRIITPIESLAQATIHALLPGNYGGLALANLLSGDANFSAKLPFTYPKYTGSFATYDYKPCENMATMEGAYNYDAVMDVLYPFGSGLSYTTFRYSNLRIDKPRFQSGEELTFQVDVTNTGRVAGSEPVLLFISDMVATLTPDVKRLRGFDKVTLAPGETKTVTLSVQADDLAFVDTDLRWVLEKGDFRAAIGDQNIQFTCTRTARR